VIATELERLCREIERLLSYYRSLYAEHSYEGALSRLILCGDAAGLQGLDRYFTRVLQIEVEVENPFQTLTSAAVDAVTELTVGQKSTFTVACGLALGQLARENRTEYTGGNEICEPVWLYRTA
jgi:Tfp pilus assembly PilM family ATPase